MRRGILVAALGVAAVGAWWLLQREASPDGYRFEVGATDVFDVEWTTAARASLPFDGVEPFSVSSALAGTFVVTTLEVSEERVVQRAVLRDLDRLRVSVDGERVPIDGLALTGVDFELHRGPRGGLVDVRGLEDVDASVRSTLLGLAKTFAVPEPGSPERRAVYGRATDRWSGMERTTSGYSSLQGAPVFAALEADGAAKIQLDRGQLRSISAEESARAVSDGTVWLEVSDASEWTWRASGSAPVRRRLAAATPSRTPPAADAWSTDRVVGAVSGHRSGEDASATMWHGTRHLADDPAAAHRVGALASSAVPLAQRELALDLLAHTPDGGGEEALLAALSSLEDAPHFDAFLQRLAFVDAPSMASVERLVRLSELEGDTGRAALVALGAVGLRVESPEVAMAVLRSPLDADSERAAAQLGGLGNAHQDEDLERILRATTDPRPRVRAAAVHALRHYPDAEVMPALTVAFEDSNGGVQRAALSLLEPRTLAPSVLAQVASLTEGEIRPENLGVLTNVLSRYPDQPAAREALEALLGHPGGDATLRGRIRTLLREG